MIKGNKVNNMKNYNDKEKLIEYLLKKYHPKFYNNINEFANNSFFSNKNITIDDYTDGYITEKENYIIILFDDYRDFSNAIETDNFYGDCIIAFGDNGKIAKRYYTSCDDQQINYIESFINKTSN